MLLGSADVEVAGAIDSAICIVSIPSSAEMLVSCSQFHSFLEILVAELELILLESLQNMRLREWVAQEDSEVVQGVHDSLHLPRNEVVEGHPLDSAVLLLGIG